MNKEETGNWIIGLLVLLAIYFVIVLTITIIIKIGVKIKADMNEVENELSEREICRLEHGKEIMEYVKECTSSLKVEENAYVISECESVAIRNLCI